MNFLLNKIVAAAPGGPVTPEDYLEVRAKLAAAAEALRLHFPGGLINARRHPSPGRLEEISSAMHEQLLAMRDPRIRNGAEIVVMFSWFAAAPERLPAGMAAEARMRRRVPLLLERLEVAMMVNEAMADLSDLEVSW